MPQTIHRGIKSLIDEANAQIETLSAADAIKAAQGDDVVIVDIRDPREIERDGRIPGAFSCTRGFSSPLPSISPAPRNSASRRALVARQSTCTPPRSQDRSPPAARPLRWPS